MLHELHDRERLRLLYEADPLVTVRARSILYGLHLPAVRILVDDPDHPRGALLTHDGLLWDVYSPNAQVARNMLDEFPRREHTVFFGLAGPLLEHVRRSFEGVTEIPATLYALADPAHFRPANPAGETIGVLAPEHAGLVADAWTVHDFESPEARLAYVRSCIERGPTAAVLREGRPVAYGLTHADGSIGILHTEPAFRRQGLGRQVLSALVRTLLERRAMVYAYVAVGNVPSIALMEATGLRAVQEGAVVTVGPRRETPA
jgi:ribosomal protein S18 acetylase RimI-like enzyme